MISDITGIGPKHYPMALRLKCRREYIHGEGTLPEIAARHRLRAATVHRWSVDEGWGKLRAAWVALQMKKDETIATPSVVQPHTSDLAGYVGARLARIRKHIEDTDAALELAHDPLDRERLSRSLAQLQETERVLAGRPAPGAYRPRQVKQAESCVVEPV